MFQKLLRLVGVLFAISVFTFLLTSLLPGDPAVIILGRGATPAQVKNVRHDLYLDRSLPVRYEHWIGKVVRGDLGRSYRNNEPVSTIIRQRLPVTLELLVLAQVLALGLAIPFALLAAYRRDSAVDKVTTGVSFGLLSVPDFVAGIVLVYLLAVRFRVFPASGYVH